MSKYHIKVIAGVNQYEKEDMFGETALSAVSMFIREYIPRDAIIVTIEVVDLDRTVKV